MRRTEAETGQGRWLIVLLVALAAACSGSSSSAPPDGGQCEGSACSKGKPDAATDGSHKVSKDGGTDGRSDAGTDAGPSETLDPTVPSNLAFTSQFLYVGPNAVQTGVAAGTIDLTRVSVIRGQVLVHSTAAGATNGLAPIVGVGVLIVGHPELGATKTGADGWYSMVVNGGGLLSVAYALKGYLPVQRSAVTRWLEYTVVNPAVLTAPEPGTSVTLSASSTAFQVVRGKTHGTSSTMTPTEDADGPRTATILIPPGTTASLAALNGKPVTMRATECTTGSSGLMAMPADLPPTSAYTYAVNLSIDEANGAPLTFSQPVIFYLDNFVGFPVGDGTNPTAVPAGYYDETRGIWVPSASGQVVRVLTNAGGTVTLDVAGSGQDAADSVFTPPLVAGERAQIASLYKAGATFWRVGTPHFSWWDDNWGDGPPAGAVVPKNPPGNGGSAVDKPCPGTGSIIECENQILAEQFPLVGTPYGLRYQSERTAGRQVSVQIPITGTTALPSVVTGIEILVATQGRQWSFHSTSLAPNQSITWTWDRTDAFGRTVSGHSDVQVQVGYDYQATSSYQATGQFGAFGNGIPITGNRALRQLTIWQYSTFPVDQIDARTSFGLGGLSLTAQDLYDSFGRTFYGGDGSRRTVDGNHFTTITTYAGGASGSATGVPATSVGLSPTHLAAGADGTLYIADNTYVRMVDPKTGVIQTIGGNGDNEALASGNPGDGMPATSVAVSAYGVAVDGDGAVYVTTEYTNRIRRIDPSTGVIATIAGSGLSPENCTAGTPCSDGQAATTVALGSLGGVVVGPDGCVYFSEGFVGGIGGRVRKVELDGTLTTLIDNLASPDGVALGADGSVYVVDNTNDSVVRLWPTGQLATVAGGQRGNSGDGGPATQAAMFRPTDVAVLSNGAFYITDTLNFTLRYVDPLGLMHTVTNPSAATLATEQVTDDNGPEGAATLYEPLGVAIGPEGNVYVADSEHFRVRAIHAALPGFDTQDRLIPSVDGTTVDHFFTMGQHEFTRDGLTGNPLITFNYDSLSANDEQLVGLTDDVGNTTTIARTAGKVVITAPFGQATTLNLDASGYVASLVNPNGETVGFTYKTTAGAENGLLATLTDPKGQVHTFDYTPEGLLSEDDNPAGGQKKLVRSGASSQGWTVTHTTKMGYVSTFAVTTPADGSFQRVATGPAGASVTYAEGVDGSQTTTWSDATGAALKTSVVQLGPDPRYDMIAPIAASTTATLEPSGLSKATTHTRTASVGATFLDLATQTDVLTVNAGATQPQVTTTTYTAGTSTNSVLVTTTTGRTLALTLDADDRITSLTVPAIAAESVSYNTTPCPAGGEGCGGRVTSVTATIPSDGTRSWTPHYKYGPDTGFASSVVDPLGEPVAWKRDPVGHVLQAQIPDLSGTTDAQNQVHATYDLNGNLSTLTLPSTATTAPVHTFPLYSPIDDLKTYEPPALTPALATSATSYTYNFDDQLTLVQVPDSATYDTINIGHDAVGRVQTIADSKSGVTATYTYAPGGATQSVSTSDGETLAYGFGVDGRLLMSSTWSGTVAGSVAFTHDDFFRVASRTVNGGTSLAYQYDADGLYAGTAGLVALTLQHDVGGKNGLLAGSAVGSVTDAYSYNGFGELKTYAASFSGTALYSTSITTRDALGRIQTMTETLSGTTNNWTFAYDPHGDLASATEDGVAAAYVFDPNGNRLSAAGKASTYDAQDRLLTGPGATYTYTNNGDLVTKVTAAGTTTYTYDLRNALRSVTLPSGDAIGYTIDGQGRRVGKSWKRGGATVTQGFLYDDQLRVAAGLDGLGNVVSTFVYGAKPNVPDVMVRGGNTYRLVTDWRGSVRAVVDANNGTVAQTIDYDAWGNATVNDTTCAAGAACALIQPFAFAGGLYDKETGLVRFGARDYVPQAARWAQKDTTRFTGGRNLYAYAWNNPVTFIDPSGMYALGPVAAAALETATALGTEAAGVAGPVAAGGSGVSGGVVVGAGLALGVGVGLGGAFYYSATTTNPPSDEGPDEGGAPSASSQQYKRLSSGEISAMQQAGVDPHDLKPKQNGSRYDLFKTPCGDIVVMPKNGQGDPDPTGYNINEF
jgi:RHS repeat-associated protein